MIENNNIQEKTFEELFKELGCVVEKLEGGQLSLEESLDLFQEGIELTKKCKIKLDNAERKIEKLLEENGQIKTEPFE